MKATAAKWGNSVGIRIPASIASDVGIKPGTEVRVSREGRSVRITSLPQRRHTLKALVAGITKQNRHGETAAGKAVGAEVID
jgi:antitoxin MazE